VRCPCSDSVILIISINDYDDDEPAKTANNTNSNKSNNNEIIRMPENILESAIFTGFYMNTNSVSNPNPG